MSRTKSDEKMALPPIRQAVPEILEAIPVDHDKATAFSPIPTPPQSRPPTEASSFAPASTTTAHLSDQGRHPSRQLWDSEAHDSRPRQMSHASSQHPPYHSPSLASGTQASGEYHGALSYSEISRDSNYRSRQPSYHHGSSPRATMPNPNSMEAQQLGNQLHHESTSTDGSSGLARRPHMISTGSSESRTPSEPISPDFASPSYYDEQEGSQHPNYQGQQKPYTDYSYPVRPLHIISDFESQKNKRRRGNLPKHVTDLLRRWYSEHRLHPYPTEDEKQQLMSDTGLSIAQISNWFINARRRQPRTSSAASSPRTTPSQSN